MKDFKPLQPTNAKLDKHIFPCWVQKKYDGEKLVWKDDKPLSRRLKPVKNQWLTGQLEDLLGTDLGILEGEVQVDGTFEATAGFLNSGNREGNFIYWVFDLVADGTYAQRYAMLEKIVADIDDPRLQIVGYDTVMDMDELMAFHVIYDADPALDGTITVNPDADYKFGRSTGTVQEKTKIKSFEDSEAVIKGYTERMHNTNAAKTNELGRTERSSAKAGLEPTGLIATYLCDWNGVDIEVTATGTLESRKERFENFDDLCMGKFVKFQFQGVFPSGKPRFPTELALRHEDDMGETT